MPPNSSRSTRAKAFIRSPCPKTRSWSNLMPRWPFRSMWNSLPCHSACATPWVKFSPAICSWPTSGFSPTISWCSRLATKARAWPTVGSRMSPRGSFGFGSSANRMP